MNGSIWAMLPPIIAIIMALLTKEVYSSLLLGILIGCFMYTGLNPIAAIETCFDIMEHAIGSNAAILVFLALLGMIVALITKSGASKAYGEWAAKKIKSRRSALLATSALGCLIFVDDYFNCLTVGTVMRPVTDKYQVTRAKLAYIIDATAAPICIIAPISSWAAAVSSSLPKGSDIDGFALFLSTIPFNLYALLTLVFICWLMMIDRDFLAMKHYNKKAEIQKEMIVGEEIEAVGHGKVIDLVFPILTLIVLCVGCMLYSGGIFDGASIIEAFSNCDAASSLVLGTFMSLIITFIFYLPRKVLTFNQFTDSFVEGLKSMAPAMMILCLAWTLSGICSQDYLNLGAYVASVVSNMSAIYKFMPFVFFVTALGLAFATGTSWGCFSILIPIIVAVFPQEGMMLSLTVGACLAGTVAGDHISPISDTTILSSAGAQCYHLDHVSTQMPYALCVVAMGGVAYLIGGLFENGWIALLSGLLIFALSAFIITIQLKKE